MSAPVDTLQARRAHSEALARQARLGAERPLRIGRYSIHDLIGVGGMATVHLGRLRGAADFSRTVAIKRLLPQYADDAEFGALFMREVKLASRVQHPNVVMTLDALSQDGELILVMDYVEGETLFRLLWDTASRTTRAPQPVVLRILVDALRGLAAVHQAKDLHGRPLGMVHRDISPHNLMIGVDGVTRLLDFGIAKAAESVDATETGVVRGKASYISPEQLLKHPLSQRSDLYAIGVVAWEALVGERLFPHGGRLEMLDKIAGKVARPRQRNPLVSEALDAVVMRAIAPKQADRFESAESMIQALQACAFEASPEEVGDWVRRVGREALAKRRAIVARVEGAELGPSSSTRDAMNALSEMAALESVAEPVVTEAARLRVLSWRSLGAVALAWLLAFAFVLWGGRSPPPSRSTQGPASGPNADRASSARPVPDRDPRVLEGAPEPAVQLQSGHPLPSSNGVPATSSRTPRARQPEPAGEVAPNRNQPASCTPPYRVDGNGHRHYKTECF